ncbi:MAG: hypothetical protein AB1782_15295 [Cyanobacteriota bacterium]
MTDIKKLMLVETSLVDSNLTIDTKLKIARQLEKLNLDIIQLSTKQKEASAQIVSDIKNITLAACCKPLQNELDDAWEILKNAAKPRLRIILSPELLEDLNLDNIQHKQDILKVIKDSVAYAKNLTDDIEFIIVNFNKLHKMFIYRMIEQAADSETKTITIYDQKGLMLTDEVSQLYKDIFYNIPDEDKLIIGSIFTNTMGIATANSLAAIANGSRQVDVTLIHSGSIKENALFSRLLQAIKLRKDIFNLKLNINSDEWENTLNILKEI